MTKAEIVGKIAEGAELTKAQAEKAASVFLDSIVEALKDGDKVTFVGFGTFSVSDKAARVGRNPQTGAEIKRRQPKRNKLRHIPGKARLDNGPFDVSLLPLPCILWYKSFL